MRWKTPVCLYCLRLGWAQARKERGGYFIFHISRHKLNFVNNGTKAWHTEFSRSKLVTSVIQSTSEAHYFVIWLVSFGISMLKKSLVNRDWLLWLDHFCSWPMRGDSSVMVSQFAAPKWHSVQLHNVWVHNINVKCVPATGVLLSSLFRCWWNISPYTLHFRAWGKFEWSSQKLVKIVKHKM